MSKRLKIARRIVRKLAGTPLHPQWLLGSDSDTASWIKDGARGRVLDVGCADRWVEKHLSAGCEYVGLDYPATGKDLYGASPHLFADASRLPLRDCCVDTVLMVEVLEHLRSPMEALLEVERVLCPQGKVLLSMPFLYPIHDAPHDYQRLTRHGLVRDVEAAGLTVDKMWPRLGSAESAGLIVCLCLSGMAVQAIKRPRANIVLVPLLLAAIPIVNLLAWAGGKLLPSWDAITNGYQLVASKQ